MRESNFNSTSPGTRLSQAGSMATSLALASWKLWSTRTKSELVTLYVSQTGVRGYTVSRGNGIAGIADLDGGVTRAASTSLSRNEGHEHGDRGKSQQLLGEEHVSVVLTRVGGLCWNTAVVRQRQWPALIAEVRRRNE